VNVLEVKMFEVRDRMTFIPVVAVLMESTCETPYPYEAKLLGLTNPKESYLLRRAGYAPGSNLVSLFSALSSGGPSHYDPHGWNSTSRTMSVAHQYIGFHWSELNSGDVIDVEFILWETTTAKTSEHGR
jgi:hypothetical protein